MMNRTITTEVTFRRPFRLEGMADLQPAGTYVVETEEELLQALSFPAWRRLDTTILLPHRPGGPMIDRSVTIDPAALEAALALDAVGGAAALTPGTGPAI
jgi:hypothetical protein